MSNGLPATPFDGGLGRQMRGALVDHEVLRDLERADADVERLRQWLADNLPKALDDDGPVDAALRLLDLVRASVPVMWTALQTILQPLFTACRQAGIDLAELATSPLAPARPAPTTKEPPMRPTVGRSVHYVSYGTPIREDGTQAFRSLCRAATVTEVDPVDPTRVGLEVHNPTGLFFHPLSDGGCRYDEGGTSDTPGAPDARSYEGGSWHWPEPAPIDDDTPGAGR
jgi:hypothetical protein